MLSNSLIPCEHTLNKATKTGTIIVPVVIILINKSLDLKKAESKKGHM